MTCSMKADLLNAEPIAMFVDETPQNLKRRSSFVRRSRFRASRDAITGQAMLRQACRGPNMMMAMPTRLTATPTQSVVVGLTLSTSISQTMATPM